MKEMEELMAKIVNVQDKVNVNMVFGAPQTYDNVTLIPIAEVMYGFGGGMGYAEGMTEVAGEEKVTTEASEAEDKNKTAAGGGGGAGARVRPLAYIEIGPEGTSIKSITDDQQIALAGIALSAWIFGWLGLVLKVLFSKK